MSKPRKNRPVTSADADAVSRTAICSDLLTNILVEAGAGSGKTEMLARRMAAGIAEGVYTIENMAAVTFTRKAASELRGRFHLALETEYRRRVAASAAGASPEHRDSDATAATARLEYALANLERFFAGTIHSFCARLLRERPVEAGVSPGFTELDELQDLELRKRSWRDFIASARAAGDPDMIALAETGVRPADLDRAFSMVCGNEDVEFPAGSAQCPDAKPALRALEQFWEKLTRLLPSKIDDGTTCTIQKAARTFRGQLRVTKSRRDRPAVMTALLETWECESKIIQKWWSDSPAERKRLRDAVAALHTPFLEDVVEPYLEQWRQYVYRLSVTLLARARNHATAERRRLNLLNYGDLLNLTARVLRENADVRSALQQKYRFLFVDEFQDTDPIQAEIVFLLAADEASAASRPDVRLPRPIGGSSPCVRAPSSSSAIRNNRSIAFDAPTSTSTTSFAIGSATRRSAGSWRLTMNFRSVPALCTWANGVFQTRFPAVPSVHSPQFAALDPKDRAEGDSEPEGGVYTLTHTCDKPAEVLAADAAAIARFIRTEVDKGRRRYSDFLILTRRKRNRIAPYAAALEALNMPVEISGAGAFGESAEVVGADAAPARAGGSAGRAARWSRCCAARYSVSAIRSCLRSSRTAVGSACSTRQRFRHLFRPP